MLRIARYGTLPVRDLGSHIIFAEDNTELQIADSKTSWDFVYLQLRIQLKDG